MIVWSRPQSIILQSCLISNISHMVLSAIQAIDLEDYVCGVNKLANKYVSTKEKREDVRDRDLVLSLIIGVVHDFDAIVAAITTQRYISLEDAQLILMMHEQRVEHLNSPGVIDICQGGKVTAHYVSDTSRDKRGQRDGNSQNYRVGQRGRGKSYRNGGRAGSRIHCQICNKHDHGLLKCYNRFDQGFHGPPQKQQSQALYSLHQMYNQSQGIIGLNGQSYNGQMLSQDNMSPHNTEPQAHFNQTSVYLATPNQPLI
ncbi:hypothetical protein Ddye_029956 [Dipteronia dyeriana]|uniref:Uncharacterized protein n=1 Tax=Dipteronia dyeriana TaxID=168575 RepID=A0AAD9TGH8_9ROSI|nr:hypothetical protein Ddye_029956 [Dipteronia dyeriana]